MPTGRCLSLPLHDSKIQKVYNIELPATLLICFLMYCCHPDLRSCLWLVLCVCRINLRQSAFLNLFTDTMESKNINRRCSPCDT